MINILEVSKFLDSEKVNDIRIYNKLESTILVGTVTSLRYMKFILKKFKILKWIIKEDVYGSDSEWVICSFYDFDLHLFTFSKREYYDLDSLWGN